MSFIDKRNYYEYDTVKLLEEFREELRELHKDEDWGDFSYTIDNYNIQYYVVDGEVLIYMEISVTIFPENKLPIALTKDSDFRYEYRVRKIS